MRKDKDQAELPFAEEIDSKSHFPKIKNVRKWFASKADEKINPVIPGLFDRGDKVAIIAPPKRGKTIFAIQIAASLANGEEIFGLIPSQSFKVCYLNFEVRKAHFKDRLRRVLTNPVDSFSEEEPSLLEDFENARGGNLFVLNLKGIDVSQCFDQLLRSLENQNFDIIIVDPLYQLLTGEENNSSDMMDAMRFLDALTFGSKSTVIFVHHDTKGSTAGKRDTDRGSGSGILGRNYDTAIILSDHNLGLNYAVVSFVCRNYKPPEPFTLSLTGGLFIRTEHLPIILSSQTRNQSSLSIDKMKIFDSCAAEAQKSAKAGRPKMITDLDDFIKLNFGSSGNVSKKLRMEFQKLLVEEPESYPIMLKKSPNNRFQLILI